MWKTFAILGLALSIGIGTASAQEKQHKKQQKPDAEQIFKAKDTNQDGKLSKEEFIGKATDPDRIKALEARFKAADTDGDGFLTLDELKAALAKHGHAADKQHDKKTPNQEKSTS
jgi:Ca2+-binding EF-hand superfamily protein